MSFVLHSPIFNPLSKGTIDCFLGKNKIDFFYSDWMYFILFFVFRLNICTSKVLNLLLPLGAKGAGGFQSYTTSILRNKYIYDAFLIIYLSILLLLLLFSLFGTSKELIEDPQRL